MPGIHRSLRQGRGNEFFQYRPYDPGEDLKVVDWKVYAKREGAGGQNVSGRYQFQFVSCTGYQCVNGISGSRFNLHEVTLCIHDCCLFCIPCLQTDRVGLFAYGENVQQWIRPKSGHAHFGRIVNAIAQLQPDGTNRHAAAWDQLVANMPGRSMVVFLSDFWEAEEILPERLRFALSSRYEALCLQVLDREEEKLPEGEALRFVEMEGSL